MNEPPNALDSEVNALASFGGNLYATGRFTQAGSTAVNKVASWNGTAWSALGTGLTVATGQAFGLSLLPFGGSLIVGGQFEFAGPITTKGVAQWSGTAWTALGPGLDGSVYSLAVHNGSLYAGGGFVRTGDNTIVNRISRWTGSTWVAMDGGFAPNNIVHALVSYNGGLIAGGTITSASGQSVSNIVRWNGTSWQSLGAGLDGVVFTLAVLGDSLVAGGDFASSGGGASLKRLAFWNGSSWLPMGDGVNTNTAASVKTILVVPTQGQSHLFVGGGFTAVNQVAGSQSGQLLLVNNVGRWWSWLNGSEVRQIWSSLGSGVNSVGAVQCSVNHAGSQYFGGRFHTAGGSSSVRIAGWVSDAVAVGAPEVAESRNPLGNSTLRIGDPFPNPSKSAFEIPVSLARSGQVEVHLFDVSGRMVGTLTDQYFGAGDHMLSVPIGSRRFASGVYFVRIAHEGSAQVRRLTLLSGEFD